MSIVVCLRASLENVNRQSQEPIPVHRSVLRQSQPDNGTKSLAISRMCYLPHCYSQGFNGQEHRVGRVLSFSPVVGIGTSPTLHRLTSRRECPPPPRFRGEGHTCWRERGWESPTQFRLGVVLCKLMYFVVRSKSHWPMPAVRDLTRDCRLSTYDESVQYSSCPRQVSFRVKCARTGHPLKLPSPTKHRPLGYFPTASQAGRLAGPVFHSILYFFLGQEYSKRGFCHIGGIYSPHRNYASMAPGVFSCFRFSLRALPKIQKPFQGPYTERIDL